MESKEIRNRFFRYFESKDHEIVSSAPMVIKDDPTLMFTNAGMNQFKDYFLGNRKADVLRKANSQKCLRVSGKHNDLEEVGVDTYHHTMFEMLGNWSFGDYFKKEAIEWAWDLLINEYGLPKEDIYVTVFGGDDKDGLGKDQEAIDLWKEWIAADRILEFDKKDNFWEMGEVGPCGPCSEIHIDLRSAEDKAAQDGKSLVNADHPQVIEIWNLVFMEFNRMRDGSLKPLPEKHVDTGMGFERLSMALQGKTSNYDTDVFSGLIEKVEDISGLRYKPEEDDHEQARIINVAIRVIVDHIRAIALSIADGQLPSNTGAGYVIRRILRRAVRYGYQSLNLKEPFLHRLVPVLARSFDGVFNEVKDQLELITNVVREEETSFFKTLATGLKRIDEMCISLNSKGVKELPADFAFELYDTYGFPFDLTRLIANEYELEVNEEEFEANLDKQRTRSRDAAAQQVGDWTVLMEDDVEEFVGYDYTDVEVMITRYREVTQKDTKFYQLVFNITPFYPEGGGQVGDTGMITANGESTPIINTRKENNLILHFSETLPSDLKATFRAQVDVDKRTRSAANHTATHLLHQALREVLGTHVEQKGSLVNPDYLRFDFSHFQKVTPEEQEKIESLVNERVGQKLALEEHRDMPIAEAQKQGAMMLFGEKYGDVVRMIKFGESVELCGGTHLGNTEEIGQFILTSESAVAAGIRRVEALSGVSAKRHLSIKKATLNAAKDVLAEVDGSEDAIRLIDERMVELDGQLSNLASFETGDIASVAFRRSKDDAVGIINSVVPAIEEIKEFGVKEALQSIKAKLAKEAKKQGAGKASEVKSEIREKITEQNGVNFLAIQVALDPGSMKDISFQLKNEVQNLFLVLGAENNGKANLTVAVSESLVNDKGLHAGNIIRELASDIGGGGGGQPFFASAGGKDPAGIEKALSRAADFLN